MREIILIIIIIIFFMIGDRLMKKVDESIERNDHHLVLVIYDDMTLNNVETSIFGDTMYLNIEESFMIEEKYDYCIIYTSNDYNNLMLNYHLKKKNNECKIYCLCNEKDNYHLYRKEKINMIHKDDLKDLMTYIYEKGI